MTVSMLCLGCFVLVFTASAAVAGPLYCWEEEFGSLSDCHFLRNEDPNPALLCWWHEGHKLSCTPELVPSGAHWPFDIKLDDVAPYRATAESITGSESSDPSPNGATIVLPEPERWVQLVVGCIALPILYRLKARM